GRGIQTACRSRPVFVFPLIRSDEHGGRSRAPAVCRSPSCLAALSPCSAVQLFRPRLGYFQTCLCLSVRVWIVESTAVRAGIVTAGRPVVRRGRHWRYVARGSVVYPQLKLLQRRGLAPLHDSRLYPPPAHPPPQHL